MRDLARYAPGPAAIAGVVVAASVAGAAWGMSPWGVLVNPLPQRTIAPAAEHSSIHYPRAGRSGSDVPGSPGALLRELYDLHTAMRYEQAAAVARRLIELSPDSASARYNLAAVLGRLQLNDEALDALEQAVDAGWRDLTHLLIDPDLSTLRSTSRYRAIVSAMKELIAEESAGSGAAPGAECGPGALPSPPPEVAAEAGLRVIALAALLRHGADLPASAAFPLDTHRRIPPSVRPEEIVQAVESATSEPFSASCRRLVVGPLGLDETAIAAGDALAPSIRTTPGDLGLVLQYIDECLRGVTPHSDADHLERLAWALGLAAEPDGQGLRVSFRAAHGVVVLRYDPPAATAER